MLNKAFLIAATRVTEEVKCREEKATRSQCELRRVLEGLAVQLSSPARFVDAQEENIRERIRELQHECKERSVVSYISLNQDCIKTKIEQANILTLVPGPTALL